jgi:hypothetical protein
MRRDDFPEKRVVFVPEGQTIVAQRFNAGLGQTRGRVPEGRLTQLTTTAHSAVPMGLDAATPLTQCLKHWAILTSPSGTNPSRRSNVHCLNQPRHSKPYLSAIRVNAALLRFDSSGGFFSLPFSSVKTARVPGAYFRFHTEQRLSLPTNLILRPAVAPRLMSRRSQRRRYRN